MNSHCPHTRTSRRREVLCLAVLGILGTRMACAQFASRVIEYQPSPGQLVQNAAFNDPARALGAPIGSGGGGGLSAPDNTKLVTLGGFGGTITLGFEAPIWHNPHNPRGMDVVVFGNAFFVAGDPLRRFAEPGVVEVSRDDNHNTLADDAWYLIPGSHLATTAMRVSRVFDAAALSPAWIPAGRSGTWSVQGYRLPSVPFEARPPLVNIDPVQENVWGYADLAPTMVLGDTDGDDIADDAQATPAAFYARADDPRSVGVSPACGGGSAISIAWAVHPATGAPAQLDRVDFIRISTGVDFVDPLLGEMSTEVSGVADVAPVYAPDWNHDQSIGVQDIFDMLADWFAASGEAGGADFNASGATTVQDIFDFLSAWFSA